MVTGIVEHQEYPPSAGLPAQESLEETLEPRAMLLEVAFIQAPQFDVGAPSQATV